MIKLNTTDFSKKAQNLLRFSDGETTHLIYKGDKLCLQSKTCTAYVGAEDIGEEQAFIPQKAIVLINRLSTDYFELAIEDGSVAVRYNRSASNFQMSNNIYEPKIFEGDIPEMNSIDKSLLQQIKRLTRYCSSDSQSNNPTTCGLYFNGNGEKLDIVATDGYTINSIEEVGVNKTSADGRFTGPCYIARKWQPYEISIVSVPADDTVGVGRDAEFITQQEEAKPQGNAMKSIDATIRINKNLSLI